MQSKDKAYGKFLEKSVKILQSFEDETFEEFPSTISWFGNNKEAQDWLKIKNEALYKKVNKLWKSYKEANAKK